MRRGAVRQVVAAAAVMALLVAACGDGEDSAGPDPTGEVPSSETPAAGTAGESYKLGLITKFPVDFFFVIEEAAKEWAAAHPDVELITGQGAAGDDHEGQIAIIESMVAQGVDGIAITPTGEAVQPALDAAIAAGVDIVLLDNDLPNWDGKSSVVARGGV